MSSGNSSLLRYGENRLPSHFFLPFSLRNKQRRRRRLSYKSFSMLLLTWVHSTVVPRGTEDNAYAKSRGSNNATPWRLGYLWFYTQANSIDIPRDSPLAEERWSNICGSDEPSTETKCRLSSTIRYHWQQKLESVRFSCASATSLSFPERKKSMFWLFPRFPVGSSQTLINIHNSNQQFTKPLTCEIINNNFWTLELMSSSLELNPWDF